jgi:hypothetical protein
LEILARVIEEFTSAVRAEALPGVFVSRGTFPSERAFLEKNGAPGACGSGGKS